MEYTLNKYKNYTSGSGYPISVSIVSLFGIVTVWKLYIGIFVYRYTPVATPLRDNRIRSRRVYFAARTGRACPYVYPSLSSCLGQRIKTDDLS